MLYLSININALNTKSIQIWGKQCSVIREIWAQSHVHW